MYDKKLHECCAIFQQTYGPDHREEEDAPDSASESHMSSEPGTSNIWNQLDNLSSRVDQPEQRVRGSSTSSSDDSTTANSATEAGSSLSGKLITHPRRAGMAMALKSELKPL